MAMVDTSSLSIWDLSNNCVVSSASFDDFTNSDIANNEITGIVYDSFFIPLLKSFMNFIKLNESFRKL